MNRRDAIRHGFLVGLFTALGEMPKLLGNTFLDAPIMEKSELTINMDIDLLRVGDVIAIPGGMRFIILSKKEGEKAIAKNLEANYSIQTITVNHKSTEQLEADPHYIVVASAFAEALNK